VNYLKHSDDFLKTLPDCTFNEIEKKIGYINISDTFRYRFINWLNNFRTAEEKELAVKLFLNLDYLSHQDIEDRLRRVKFRIDQNAHERGGSLKECYLILPNQNADSASRHAYDITKLWDIPPDRILKINEARNIDPKLKYFIFFNDTHGSGNQFIDEFGDLIIELGESNCIIACFIISSIAFTRFRQHFPDIAIVPEIPTTSIVDLQCFNKNELEIISNIGDRVYPIHPLGYGNAGL